MTFTPKSEKRISDVVRRVERMRVNPPARRRQSRPRQHSMRFGKLDGALAQGGSATMSVWMNDPLADTGHNLTVYDWFLGTGESIDAGKKVKVEFYCGKWYVTAAEC